MTARLGVAVALLAVGCASAPRVDTRYPEVGGRGVMLCPAYLPVGERIGPGGELIVSVIDWEGAPMPGSKVALQNDGHGASVVADERGTVHFTDLSAGQFSVTVTLSAFSSATVNGVGISDGCLTTLSVPLELGADVRMIEYE